MSNLIITLEETQKPISPDDLLKLYPEAVATSISGNISVGIQGESLERMTKAIQHEEGCNRKIAIWESSDDPEEGCDPIAFAEWKPTMPIWTASQKALPPSYITGEELAFSILMARYPDLNADQQELMRECASKPLPVLGTCAIVDTSVLVGLGIAQTVDHDVTPLRLGLTELGSRVQARVASYVAGVVE